MKNFKYSLLEISKKIKLLYYNLSEVIRKYFIRPIHRISKSTKYQYKKQNSISIRNAIFFLKK